MSVAAAPIPAPARAAIDQLLAGLAAAWQAGDAPRYAALFTADADYVAFDGSHLRGRAANEELHRSLFGGLLRGSEMLGPVLTDLRLLAPDVLLLHCTGAVRLRWQRRPPAARQSIQTMVAVREADGQWRIAAFQNTRISPPGRLARLFARLLG